MYFLCFLLKRLEKLGDISRMFPVDHSGQAINRRNMKNYLKNKETRPYIP